MKINVKHVAKLANLTIPDKDLPKFEKQLSDILQYIEKLGEVDTKNITPTSQVTGLENIVRQDFTLPSLPQSTTLSNAKNQKNGFFQVQGILDSE